MTPLATLLARRIEAAGPMTLADYMAECLMHPRHGYYATRDPFGAQGDFTTAPEISQMFGELIGLCLAQCWLDQGAPASVTLAELGPGRGTLMADILRATRGVPGFHEAAQVVLVETSAALRSVQRRTLGTRPVEWLDSAEDLPDRFTLLVANEFFDALPIRQFVRDGSGWRERMVGLQDGALAFGLGPETALAALAHRLEDTRQGEIVEFCPAAGPVMAAVAARIAAQGGAALVVDYGGWHSRGDTLQALQAHRFADPLACPGEADLTAHVDFEALAAAALPCGTACTTQGDLLLALGIEQRARRLAQSLSGEALASHEAATRRLTDAAEMGTLFKALAVFPPQGPAPAGFAG
ncbi:SAM-dependent methyltransferase [Cereibacter sphaeroides]|uniref:class I SAM-dependent methyltransferase n=1 Tax=Cereibacter sphaeroides TaxID=1063 RepID=UPI001F420026|nr:SAM-dependent methyltransferase [Cereibacter sphaeroides]MCE6951818.1 SAM-dependent methyltransferase [Cereibacter sphaeroides]